MAVTASIWIEVRAQAVCTISGQFTSELGGNVVVMVMTIASGEGALLTMFVPITCMQVETEGGRQRGQHGHRDERVADADKPGGGQTKHGSYMPPTRRIVNPYRSGDEPSRAIDRVFLSLLSQVMKRAGRTVRVAAGTCEIRSFDPQAVAAARRTLPSGQGFEQTAESLGILAHPSRLRLLVALEGRELCVCDCAQVLGAKLPATSQHLRELRRIGAIAYRTEGKMAYYRLADRRWLAIAEAAQKIVANPPNLRASA